MIGVKTRMALFFAVVLGIAVLCVLAVYHQSPVVTSFILWTSAEKGQPWGLGLPLPLAVSIGAAVALAFAAYALRRTRS